MPWPRLDTEARRGARIGEMLSMLGKVKALTERKGREIVEVDLLLG